MSDTRKEKVTNPFRTEYEISERIEVLESLNKMMDGFYGLLGIGDDWWEYCSFTTFESEMVKELWNGIDVDNLMDNLNKIQIVLMGSYCAPKRFLEGLKLLSSKGIGVYNLRRNDDSSNQ